KLREFTQLRRAVAAMSRIKRFCLEMFTVFGNDFFSRKPFLHLKSCGKSVRTPRGIRVFRLTVFFIALRRHARHAPAQSRQLLLKLTHGPYASSIASARNPLI